MGREMVGGWGGGGEREGGKESGGIGRDAQNTLARKPSGGSPHYSISSCRKGLLEGMTQNP